MGDDEARVGVHARAAWAASAGAPATSGPSALSVKRRCSTWSTSRCQSYAGVMSHRPNQSRVLGTWYRAVNSSERNTNDIDDTHSLCMRPLYSWMASSVPVASAGMRSSRSARVTRGVGRGTPSGSGGGTGRSSSQPSGTRPAGSCASSAWRMVVPVRGAPVTNDGPVDHLVDARRGRRATYADRLWARTSSNRSRKRRVIQRPRTVSSASSSSAGRSTASGSRKSSSPKPSMPRPSIPSSRARLGEERVAVERELGRPRRWG